MTSKPSIYQLKLTLSDIRPPIWRRIEVLGGITLYRFAAILITAMGWHGGHLHQFRIGEKYYGIPDDEFPSDLETHDERETLLKDIVEAGIKRFIFEYDFGDGWEHVVEFEKAVDQKKGVKYPRCTAGARQCPPEDCGGPPGYEHFLEAIRDSKHPEHVEMLKWIGGDFDPEGFNLGEVSDLAAARDMEKDWNEHFE